MPHRIGILSDQPIGSQKRDPFHQRLRNQNPVEQILMRHWQAIDGDSMLTEHGQLFVTVIQQSSPQET